MPEQCDLTAAMEDYLETVYLLEAEAGVARVKDIATNLGVRMPSVTNAIATLKRLDLVNQEKYGGVYLTLQGRAAAEDVYRRHEALLEFLAAILKMEPAAAQREACQLEHALSDEALARLVRLNGFVHDCPACRRRLLGPNGSSLNFSSCGNCDQCPAREAEAAGLLEC